jgi:3-hydroxyisobutyrate dehydrogenase
MLSIGFIGLGHMGQPMVGNLLKAGFDVKVFDVMSAAIETAVAAGAEPAHSVLEATSGADVIFTMLQSGDQVRDVCLGETGFFSQVKPGILYIDCSSIEITITKELHVAAEQAGIEMLDAPVSGGVKGATAATLAIMVGGAEKNFLRAQPIFEKIGKKIVHAGAASLGQAAKICNNLILGISMIAVCEGFNLAKKLGLDAKNFFEISSNASGQCWAMTSNCPEPGVLGSAPADRDYQPGFMAKMMLKDLHLGGLAAQSVGAAIPLGLDATQLYSSFVEEGYGEMDFSAIIKMIAALEAAT